MILLSMYKKLLAVAVVLFSLFAFRVAAPSMASAQQWWKPSASEFNQKVNDESIPASEIFGERYTHAQVYWIIWSIVGFINGGSTMDCAAEASSEGDQIAGVFAFSSCLGRGGIEVDSGAPGTSAPENSFHAGVSRPKDFGVISLAMLSDQILAAKPASGVQYLASTFQRIAGVPDANAQTPNAGFGFNALSPLQNVWVVARNAAYALSILAVIALSFMVMFRTKISPQAAVTVQSAIPRIIIGLLLITFSFAIAGFVVDMAYVVQGVVVAIISQSNLTSNASSSIDLFNMTNNVLGGIVSFGFITILIMFVVALIAGTAGWLIPGLSAVLGLVVILIVLAIFVVAVFKIFWLLLRTYVMIIFHVIALPFAALGYMASAQGNPFASTLRSLVGQVSVFVTISFVVMLAHLVFWNMAGWPFSEGPVAGIEILNPYKMSAGGALAAGDLGMPGFGMANMANLALFIGLVVLLMATGVASNIRDRIITGRSSGSMGLMGLGAGGAVVSGAASWFTTRGPLGENIINAENRAQRVKDDEVEYPKALRRLRRLQARASSITGAVGQITRKL